MTIGPPPRRRALLGLADLGGYAVRAARRPARFLPAVCGFGVVSWGVGMIYVPAGVIAAGVSILLLVADNNTRTDTGRH